jgi:hypothetical protein
LEGFFGTAYTHEGVQNKKDGRYEKCIKTSVRPEGIRLVGRHMNKWVDNIKMNLKDTNLLIP